MFFLFLFVKKTTAFVIDIIFLAVLLDAKLDKPPFRRAAGRSEISMSSAQAFVTKTSANCFSTTNVESFNTRILATLIPGASGSRMVPLDASRKDKTKNFGLGSAK
jgi:hypothetical protein